MWQGLHLTATLPAVLGAWQCRLWATARSCRGVLLLLLLQ